MLSHPHTKCPLATSVASGAPPPLLRCSGDRKGVIPNLYNNFQKECITDLVEVDGYEVGPAIRRQVMAGVQHAQKRGGVVLAGRR
ncbi:hypothetical protein B296_00053673 [Ensete ventricosum]|uniref:Uncharacterized protein n=1 Tax=Ensete ventricosum TaxID=4639 RepID=A0A426XGF6_ENSVE|nr:hypothetical protein B296_00053673 [Ensete ventricosum]